MEWNVKNALSRDVEREHLNKILADIRRAMDAVEVEASQPTDDVRSIVGSMVEGNTEQGLSVTYNAPAGVLDFAVNNFIITLAGDITGSGTVSALRNVTITTTIDPDKVGIPDAPIDNHAYWRLNGEWSQVADSILGLSDLRDEGFISQSYDDVEGEVLWAVRTFEAASGELTITNPTGLGGNPLYGLADLADSGVGTSPVQLFTRDAKGRVEGTEDASTDDLPEGITNLYFTEERAQDAVGAILADTSDIDLTYTDGTPSIEASLTASVHASLALADSAIQPGDNVSELVNDAGYVDAGGAQTAVVTGTITNGDTTHAPSGDAVFDALAGKANLSGGNTFSGAQIFDTTPVLMESTSGVMQHRIFSAVGSVADITLGEGGEIKWLFRKGASNELQITALGGAGVVLNINHAAGDLRPGGASGSKNLGSSSNRWGEIFAVNGTINTSDAREKTVRGPLNKQELAAALELASAAVIYQWNEAIAKKGDAARLHCSPTVQSVIAIMEAHGLDPFRYGFVCYDEWDETPEQRDPETGEVMQEYRPAGNRYSLRPDELAAFRDAALAQNQASLDARLKALEG